MNCSAMISLLPPVMERLILATGLQLNRLKIYIYMPSITTFFPLSNHAFGGSRANEFSR